MLLPEELLLDDAVGAALPDAEAEEEEAELASPTTPPATGGLPLELVADFAAFWY